MDDDDLRELETELNDSPGEVEIESAFVPLTEHSYKGVHLKVISYDDDWWVDLNLTVIGCHQNVEYGFHFSRYGDREQLNRDLNHLDELIRQLCVYRDRYAERCSEILDNGSPEE